MDLVKLAENIVSALKKNADEKGIALRLETDSRLQNLVIGDPTRTSQVITNLLHNAIKFTNKGWVSLTIKVADIKDGLISVEISVEDTGIGIAPEKQQLIFEQFTQADSSTSRSFGGTGLGLAISKRLLELQKTHSFI